MQKKSFLLSKEGLLRTMREVCENRKLLFVKKVGVLGQQANFLQMKGFWFVKGRLLRAVYKTFDNGNFLVCKKSGFYSSCKATWRRKAFACEKSWCFQLMQSQPIKESFFSAHRGNNFPPHQN